MLKIFCLNRCNASCCSDLLTEVDKLADEYLSSVRHMSPDKRTGHLQNIHVKFGKSRDFGDDKVQLAMQTYEMVGFPYNFHWTGDVETCKHDSVHTNDFPGQQSTDFGRGN